VAALLLGAGSAAAQSREACRDDAMIVFDASGSMAGTDFNNPPTPRIAKVKDALARVLPGVAAARRLGLIDYGPGPYNRCDNIELQLEPTANAASRIMGLVDKLVPAGRTPLTSAVKEAANVLGFPKKSAVVVLITDGEETCGGDPCGLARRLRSEGGNLTVHVIGYRAHDDSIGMGIYQSRCLADETGGLYISVDTTDQLVEALQKTLGCPIVSRMTQR
jgi:Ca-activated chloride channel homolog